MRRPIVSMLSNKPKSLQAFSLIEAAIVLAIVGLVIGGIWAAASMVSTSRRSEELKTVMHQLMEEIRPYYDGAAPSWGAYQQIGPLVVARISGLSWDSVNGTYLSSYGPVEVYYSPWNGIAYAAQPYSNYIEIRFMQLPTNTCTRMVRHIKSLMSQGSKEIVYANTPWGTATGSYRIDGGDQCSGSGPCFDEPLCTDATNTLVLATTPKS